jgi:hypothetical protein
MLRKYLHVAQIDVDRAVQVRLVRLWIGVVEQGVLQRLWT